MGDSTQATRESSHREALLGQMAHEIPGILWSTDCELRLTSTWGTGLADVNRQPNQSVGTTLFEHVQTGEAVQPAIAAHRRALRGEAVSLELEWSGRLYQAQVAPLRDHQGQIVGCIGVAQDISEKKRMQEALKQSEERYRLAAAAGRLTIWDWDLQTNAVFVDPAGKALQGYEDHEVGNHLDEFVRYVHPDDWDRLLAKGQAHLQGQEPRFEAEFRILHKDGSVRWLAAQGEAVRDADGKPHRLLGTAVDITERKQAEDATRECMARARALLDAPFDVMLLVDTAGIIRDVNQTAARSLQRTPEQLIGTYVYDLFTPPVAQTRKAKADEAIRTGKPVRFEEQRGGVTFDTTAHPVFDREGNVVEFVVWARDITDRKRAEEALRESERELGIRSRIAEVFLTTPGDEMYAEVLQVVLEALQSEHGIFAYINEDGDMVAPSLTRDVWDQCQVPDKDIVFPRQTWGGLWGRALVEGKAFWSNEPLQVPHGHIPMRRVLIVPLVHQDEVIGILEVANKATDYDKKDQALMEAIVGSVAPMLHARLQKERQERERKRAEEALRESEEKFRSVAEQSPCMIFINRKGYVVYANRKCEEITGYQREEFYSPDFNFRTLIAPESLELIHSSFARHMKGEEVEPYEYTLLSKDGGRIEAIVATKLINYGGDRAIIGTVADITARKRGEQTLRESEEKFKSVAEQSPSMVFINKNGRVVYANRRCEEIMGYKREEFYAPDFDFLRLIAPESMEFVKSNFRRHMKGEEVEPHEYAVVSRDGRTVQTIVTTKLIDYEGERAILGTVTDITERKRAEETVRRARDELEDRVRERTEELAAANRQLRSEMAERKRAEKAMRESEERFRLAFKEGPLGMAIINEDKTYARVNRAFCQMLGYSREELVGKRYVDFTHLEDVDKCVAFHAKARKGELSRVRFEKRFLTKTQDVIWVRVTGSYVRDGRGRPLYALAMYENITDQKQAGEALHRAERLASVGTLAAGIAHEINNPLGAIMLSAETALAAKGQADGDEILEKALNNIRAAALRGGRIVKSMLQFARDEVSEKWFNDLGEVARRATHATRTLANETQVAVQLALADDLPKLCINPTEMEQVLINLISNAIQASQPGDCVILRIRPASDTVQVFVEDQGRGMTRTQRSRAFDPFYTTRQQEGGTGLGLSIAHAIVEEHGGTIHAESSPLGGTTMQIVLPIGPAQSQKEDTGKPRS